MQFPSHKEFAVRLEEVIERVKKALVIIASSSLQPGRHKWSCTGGNFGDNFLLNPSAHAHYEKWLFSEIGVTTPKNKLLINL